MVQLLILLMPLQATRVALVLLNCKCLAHALGVVYGMLPLNRALVTQDLLA